MLEFHFGNLIFQLVIFLIFLGVISLAILGIFALLSKSQSQRRLEQQNNEILKQLKEIRENQEKADL